MSTELEVEPEPADEFTLTTSDVCALFSVARSQVTRWVWRGHRGTFLEAQQEKANARLKFRPTDVVEFAASAGIRYEVPVDLQPQFRYYDNSSNPSKEIPDDHSHDF